MAFYLDANVIVAMLVQEATTGAVLRFLYGAEEPLLVSDYAAAEVASSLSRLIRMGQMTTEAAHLALARFDSWRLAETGTVEIDDLDIAQAGEFVRRFELKLRTPDALHLAVCLRAGARLVTQDGVMTNAAQACGATVIHP